MKRFAMGLTYRDGHVTRQGWVKTLHASEDAASRLLTAAAQSVPGFVTCDRLIEVAPKTPPADNPSEFYAEGQVRFQLSIGNDSAESYVKAASTFLVEP
jgi:hypothetical protein